MPEPDTGARRARHVAAVDVVQSTDARDVVRHALDRDRALEREVREDDVGIHGRVDVVGNPVGIASGYRRARRRCRAPDRRRRARIRPAAADPRDVGDLHVEPCPRVHDIPRVYDGVVRRPVADPLVNQRPDHHDLACVSDHGREPEIAAVVASDEKAEVQRLARARPPREWRTGSSPAKSHAGNCRPSV